MNGQKISCLIFRSLRLLRERRLPNEAVGPMAHESRLELSLTASVSVKDVSNGARSTYTSWTARKGV